MDLPNKQTRIVAKGRDIMWITWGADTAHFAEPPSDVAD